MLYKVIFRWNNGERNNFTSAEFYIAQEAQLCAEKWAQLGGAQIAYWWDGSNWNVAS